MECETTQDKQVIRSQVKYQGNPWQV